MESSQHTGDRVCRVILDGAHSGRWNMAVDAALLEAAVPGGPATFRLYRWEEATVSLGHFQRRTPETASGGRFHGLPTVRRPSGGGAILHHHELTYSVVVPAGHPLATHPSRLYDEVHAAIAAALKEFGMPVHPRGESPPGGGTFLCFARGDRRDLICRGHKVVGSAQRRRHGAVLQHGSILLARSPYTPEFPGWIDLSGTDLDVDSLGERIVQRCVSRLGGPAVRSRLTDAESELAGKLLHDRRPSL